VQRVVLQADRTGRTTRAAMSGTAVIHTTAFCEHDSGFSPQRSATADCSRVLQLSGTVCGTVRATVVLRRTMVLGYGTCAPSSR